jgi:hypothetical protein
MFKLFSKKKNNTVIDTDTIENNNYSNIVKEIHNEFNTASDNLIEEVNKLIKEGNEKDIKKVKRLENLGFISTEQVKLIKPLLNKIELSKEQNNKFKIFVSNII